MYAADGISQRSLPGSTTYFEKMVATHAHALGEGTKGTEASQWLIGLI